MTVLAPAPSTHSLATACAALDGGELVMLIDDRRDAPCGGLLVARADRIEAPAVNRMAALGRGVVAVTVTRAEAAHLGLRQMVGAEPEAGRRHYLVSVEAAECDDTGISAADRALTLRAVAAPGAGPHSLRMPGHIHPVLVSPAPRPGAAIHEVAAAVVGLGGGRPFAAWCDVLDDSGEVASADACATLAASQGIPAITASSLLADHGWSFDK